MQRLELCYQEFLEGARFSDMCRDLGLGEFVGSDGEMFEGFRRGCFPLF